MSIRDSLAHARQGRHLTQQEVARRAGMTQPAIAALEAGRGNPTLDTLSRWAEAVEVELVAVPRERNPIVEAASALQSADDDVSFRVSLDLLDRLRELDELQFLLAVQPPPPGAGRARRDALLAAIVDLVCQERGVTPPAWCDVPVADVIWWVSPLPSARRHALATCPAPFRARGIMIDESDVVRA